MAKSTGKSAKSKMDEFERFTPGSRREWREWLAQNNGKSPGVWLVYYKKHTGKPTVSYDEAVEEALCFGWIDSVPNVIDDDRYMQLFSPRKAKSPWSRLNKTRIEKLVNDGLMTEAGQKKIDEAKTDGTWTSYDAVEDLIIPPDLAEALAANETAKKNFDAFADSYKKGILWNVINAKRPETRAKRIEEIVRLAEVNKKAGFERG